MFLLFFSGLPCQPKILYFYSVAFLNLASAQRHFFNERNWHCSVVNANVGWIEWFNWCMICGQIWQGSRIRNKHFDKYLSIYLPMVIIKSRSQIRLCSLESVHLAGRFRYVFLLHVSILKSRIYAGLYSAVKGTIYIWKLSKNLMTLFRLQFICIMCIGWYRLLFLSANVYAYFYWLLCHVSLGIWQIFIPNTGTPVTYIMWLS